MEFLLFIYLDRPEFEKIATINIAFSICTSSRYYPRIFSSKPILMAFNYAIISGLSGHTNCMIAQDSHTLGLHLLTAKSSAGAIASRVPLVAAQVKVTNAKGAHDLITVSYLNNGDIIKLYSSANKGWLCERKARIRQSPFNKRMNSAGNYRAT